MPPTYPGGSDRITVEAYLRQPRMIARALTDLAIKRFVADRIFTRGTADQVAGGAALFQKSESIFPDRNVEEVGIRSEWPRTGWTEAVFTALVHKYGLEVPIADESRRRNAFDQVARAQRKLANAVVKFVDTLAMNTILADTDVQTTTASGDWATSATDIIFDIAYARNKISSVDEGYEADTMIINPAEELALMSDVDLRNALPRESQANMLMQGAAIPILGLRQIIVTNALSAGTVLILEAGVAGTIADEAPLGDEGYVAFAPGDNQATVYVKTYRNDNVDEMIVRGARFPAMWVAEPKAVFKLTGA